jgi:esterase/lipase superfamily enzyme
VSHFISLSGSFEISSFFDGFHDDNIYFNSPYEYLPNTADPWKYNLMGIVLGTGEWGNTRHESYRLSEILNSKGYQALARRRKMARTRLELLARHAAVLFVKNRLSHDFSRKLPALA